MRRLGRYIFNGLTGLLLLVCLATGVLWIRADHYADRLAFHAFGRWNILVVSPVGIEYVGIRDSVDYMLTSSSDRWWYRCQYDDNDGDGFVYVWPKNGRAIDVGLPYWFICLITALLPAARLTARLRRKRHPAGLCTQCGYDLRATPDRCPECGTVAARAGKKTD